MQRGARGARGGAVAEARAHAHRAGEGRTDLAAVRHRARGTAVAGDDDLLPAADREVVAVEVARRDRLGDGVVLRPDLRRQRRGRDRRPGTGVRGHRGRGEHRERGCGAGEGDPAGTARAARTGGACCRGLRSAAADDAGDPGVDVLGRGPCLGRAASRVRGDGDGVRLRNRCRRGHGGRRRGRRGQRRDRRGGGGGGRVAGEPAAMVGATSGRAGRGCGSGELASRLLRARPRGRRDGTGARPGSPAAAGRCRVSSSWPQTILHESVALYRACRDLLVTERLTVR